MFAFPLFNPDPKSTFHFEVKQWFRNECPVTLEELLDGFFDFLANFDLDKKEPIVIVEKCGRSMLKKGFNVFEPVGRHRKISPKSWSNPKNKEKIQDAFLEAKMKWLDLKSS